MALDHIRSGQIGIIDGFHQKFTLLDLILGLAFGLANIRTRVKYIDEWSCIFSPPRNSVPSSFVWRLHLVECHIVYLVSRLDCMRLASAFGQHICQDYSNRWIDCMINNQVARGQTHWRKSGIVALFLFEQNNQQIIYFILLATKFCRWEGWVKIGNECLSRNRPFNEVFYIKWSISKYNS